MGYYALIKKDDVKVRIHLFRKSGFSPIYFPENEAQVLVDLQHGLRFVFEIKRIQKGLVIESDVKIENNTTISGYCYTQNWVNRKYFFTLTFDNPFTKSTQLEKKENKKPQNILEFPESKTKKLKVKIALSSVWQELN